MIIHIDSGILKNIITSVETAKGLVPLVGDNETVEMDKATLDRVRSNLVCAIHTLKELVDE